MKYATNSQLGHIGKQGSRSPLRILCVAPFVPYPVLSGGRARLAALVDYVSRHHDLTLVAFHKDSEVGLDEYDEWQSTSKYNILTVLRRAPTSCKNIPAILLNQSVYLGTHDSHELKLRLADLFRKEHFDLVHIIGSHMLQNLPQEIYGRMPLIIEESNLEPLALRQYAALCSTPARLALDFEAQRLGDNLCKAGRLADLFIVATHDDALSAGTWVDLSKLRVVPNGVNPDTFAYRIAPKAIEPRIIFLANFNYYPNIDAANVLLKSIFPRIRRLIPSVQLTVVGYGAIKRLRSSGQSDIVIKDYQLSILQELSSAWISICPLRIGTGSRIKILESMSVGTSVVSSQIGAEGLPLTNGTHAVVVPIDEMAEAVESVLRSPDWRDSLEEQGRALVEDQLSWEVAYTSLDRVYSEALSCKKKSL